jgi:F-type H+-transporting ATPase subunit b
MGVALATECLRSYGLVLASAEAEDPRPLEFRVELWIFTLIIFGVLMWVLARFAWKPIANGLDQREKSIADNIEQARLANERAQATLRQYEQRLAAAQEQAGALLAETKRQAELARERIVAEAGEEAKRQRDRALADIRAAKDQAIRELAQSSVDSAITLAGSLIGRELDSRTHDQLIQESLKRFVASHSSTRN